MLVTTVPNWNEKLKTNMFFLSAYFNRLTLQTTRTKIQHENKTTVFI